MKFDVTAIGELLIDFSQSGRGKNLLNVYTANCGGAPANVCAVIAKLGGSSAFIGKVGNDFFGTVLKKALSDLGICVDGLIMDKEANTTLAFVSLDETGEREFSFYRNNSADTRLEICDINEELILNSSIVHFGGVSLTDEPSRSATLTAVAGAKESGAIISYDPNYRPMLWKDPVTAKEIMTEASYLADVIKVSEEELLFLTQYEGLQAGCEELISHGASVVMVTLGNRGVYYKTKNAEGLVDGFKVNTVDTTGAGDAFMGAFLYHIKNFTREDIGGLMKEELNKIMSFSNAVAAITTTGIGATASIPSSLEVREFLTK